MAERKYTTVEQLYNYAREHNMEHARLKFHDVHDEYYYDIVEAKISSSIHYPDQQFIVLS